ncbi:SCO6880 family protein [Nitriliruptor alkaliphilus]|uniref:SCO6880 family protein n=1 Tax=Nitriliruptor alkaliphilus TaxID=427918 RepID=UPI000696A374|nr:SCO6880 family protein [Nitriliruptor alkaliphilus]
MNTTTEPRTYGGWRLARGMGFWGLGLAGTLLLMGAMVALMLVMAWSWQVAVSAALPIAVLTGLTVGRVDGVPISELLLRRLRWWRARHAGWHVYRAGVLVDHPRALDLPGPLAARELLEIEDGRGGTFGLVRDRRTGHLTAVLRVAAATPALVERDRADEWVAGWHQWLASLGFTDTIVWVAVTVTTRPASGTTLEDRVLSRLDPDAPASARRWLADLVAASPRACADVTTTVSITIDPARMAEPTSDLLEQTADLSRLLYGAETGLAACGVGFLGRASAAWIAGHLRSAYDPRAAGEVERALAADDPDGLLTWADAGPIAAEEAWDHYRHDTGTSVTYAWREAPRQRVTSDVLGYLLAPGRWPKRVSLLLRPLPASQATRVLEDQVQAASFRTRWRQQTGRDTTAREEQDADQATQAAREEAAGAGVVLASAYATVTVTDDAELAAATADLTARADHSRLRVRPLSGGQAAGFCTTLGIGVHPADLAARTWEQGGR